MLLKEVRSLHEALAGESNRVSIFHRLWAVFDWMWCVLQVEETSVMDVIESVTPVIVKRHLSILSIKERVNFSNQF